MKITDRELVADYIVQRDIPPMIGGDGAFKVAIFGANGPRSPKALA